MKLLGCTHRTTTLSLFQHKKLFEKVPSVSIRSSQLLLFIICLHTKQRQPGISTTDCNHPFLRFLGLNIPRIKTKLYLLFSASSEGKDATTEVHAASSLFKSTKRPFHTELVAAMATILRPGGTPCVATRVCRRLSWAD